jgi:DUF1680 family protein
MDRRNFVKAVALAPLVAGGASFSLASLDPTGSGKSAAAALAHGPMRERYELTLKRVLSGGPPAYTEKFILADVRPVAERRFTEYSGDVSGRYIGALATAALVYHTQFPGLDALVEKTIALQKPDGYFGSGFNYEKPTDHDLALLWGNGRLLVGLIEYYRLKPSAAVLASCKRLGDFMVRIGPLMLSKEIRDAFGAQHFASSYICWMQQTEGLANLYTVTKDERYRKLAGEIAAVIERRASDHVHGYLSSMRGVLDLYRATSDASLLRQCEAAWQDVAQSQDSLITGGVPEGWSPNGHRTEGCAEVDWLRFSLSLWNATGNPKYLQMAERTVFNELAFNQYATGDFGHRVYTDTGLPADGAVRAWWCCTLHGLRAFPDIHASVFRSQDGALYYDLPVDSRMETANLSAVAESSLAENGTIKIRITSANKAPATLRVRKPEWADAVKIRLNGKAAESPLEGGYVGIERPWAAGDVVEMKYAMRLRSEPSGKDRVSYYYGPWLLGAAASDNFAYFNELTATNSLIRGTEKALPAGRESARPFSVPIAATVFQCAPAEYWDQPATVTLRAIAEQAGQSTTSWELRFLTKSV